MLLIVCPYSAVIIVSIIWYMAFFPPEMSGSGDTIMKEIVFENDLKGIFCIAIKVVCSWTLLGTLLWPTRGL